MPDEAVRRGHVGFWLNKHFRLYGECHAAPIKRLGEALLLLESWGGVLELACFVIINQSCLFFFFPLNCSSGKKRSERPSLQLAAVSGFVPQFPHLLVEGTLTTPPCPRSSQDYLLPHCIRKKRQFVVSLMSGIARRSLRAFFVPKARFQLCKPQDC